MCLCFLCLCVRWARRYLSRLRLYHEKRGFAALTLQCACRQKLARNSVLQRQRILAAVSLQTQVRGYLARTEVISLRRARAATVIQSIVRMRLAVRRRAALFMDARAATIQRAYRGWRASVRHAAAVVINRYIYTHAYRACSTYIAFMLMCSNVIDTHHSLYFPLLCSFSLPLFSLLPLSLYGYIQSCQALANGSPQVSIDGAPRSRSALLPPRAVCYGHQEVRTHVTHHMLSII